MTTDIDLLLFQGSALVREAACVPLFASGGGRSLTCTHPVCVCVCVCLVVCMEVEG